MRMRGPEGVSYISGQIGPAAGAAAADASASATVPLAASRMRLSRVANTTRRRPASASASAARGVSHRISTASCPSARGAWLAGARARKKRVS